MSGSLLPHALLDFTFARAAASLEGSAVRRTATSVAQGRRYAHQSVSLENLTAPNYVPFDSDRSFYAKRLVPSRQRQSALASAALFPHMQERPSTELERRIAELKEAPVAEVPEDSAPAYTDAELISMYEELLAIPSRTQQQEVAVPESEFRRQADEATLHRAVEALYALGDPHAIAPDPKSQYTAVISKLREIVEVLETAWVGMDAVPMDLSPMTDEEWVSLVRVCVEERDGRAAETVIDLMKRFGTSVPEIALEAVMVPYAEAGDVVNAERFLTTFGGPSPPERLRDLHIKAHIRAAEPRTFPTTALSVLHEYETRGLPAPQRSYTRCITTLLSVRSTMAEAQAWDLFSHMRYVAHPTPDPYLYTIMIARCASRVLTPQPARALDLFKEMTVDKGIAPTAAAYTAAIYACARSGEKLYIGEAFRLAKEMVDGHRDAYGNPAFMPDRMTFCALLEGAKRIGDLAKVRWILAEIVLESVRAARGDVKNTVVVDEQIMTHVFHAYAAYKPPFVRATTVLVDSPSNSSVASQSDEFSTAAVADQPEVPAEEHPNTLLAEEITAQSQPPVAQTSPQFTALIPQSHAEVIGETRLLFARVLNHTMSASTTIPPESTEYSMPHAFERVQLTPRLLNAFLSVHYAHALFDEGSDLYRSLFSECGVGKNAWTYVEALERAAYVQRGQVRKQALKFAREVWAEWQGVEEAWRRREENVARVDARLVERAHAAMIRLLSLTGRLREAMQLVRAFVEHYPPTVVQYANPKDPLRSTRTSLQAPRPLVRLLSPTEVPDDTVPPLLSFPELEILHHRLVAVNDETSVSYLKYVCVSYMGALKSRKDGSLRSKPSAACLDRT